MAIDVRSSAAFARVAENMARVQGQLPRQQPRPRALPTSNAIVAQKPLASFWIGNPLTDEVLGLERINDLYQAGYNTSKLQSAMPALRPVAVNVNNGLHPGHTGVALYGSRLVTDDDGTSVEPLADDQIHIVSFEQFAELVSPANMLALPNGQGKMVKSAERFPWIRTYTTRDGKVHYDGATAAVKDMELIDIVTGEKFHVAELLGLAEKLRVIMPIDLFDAVYTSVLTVNTNGQKSRTVPGRVRHQRFGDQLVQDGDDYRLFQIWNRVYAELGFGRLNPQQVLRHALSTGRMSVNTFLGAEARALKSLENLTPAQARELRLAIQAAEQQIIETVSDREAFRAYCVAQRAAQVAYTESRQQVVAPVAVMASEFGEEPEELAIPF